MSVGVLNPCSLCPKGHAARTVRILPAGARIPFSSGCLLPEAFPDKKLIFLDLVGQNVDFSALIVTVRVIKNEFDEIADWRRKNLSRDE
jgi:hypothetical protein